MAKKVCGYFHHLTHNDRRKIEKMLNEGAKIQEIADALRTTYQTVWREVHRPNVTYTHLNSDLTTEERYSADKAQAQYEENKRGKGRPIKLGGDYAFHDYVEHKAIDENKSPYTILRDIELEGMEFQTKVCEKTLYNWIHHEVFLHLTMKALPRKGKTKQKYTKVTANARVPKGESIERRPANINDRSEPFHWEGDTVKGKKTNHKCALTLTERVMTKEIVLPLAACTKAEVVKAIDGLEEKLGADFSRVFRSITFDNGSEFQDCEGMETSKDGTKRTTVYYTHPYSSYERGTNENQNGMLRRKLPKGADFDAIPDEDFIEAARWMNGYARRRLGGNTPERMWQDALCREGINLSVAI